MKDNRPIIGITMGDPFGVGPEIAVKSLADKNTYSLCRPLLIGNVNVFLEAVTLTGLELKVQPVKNENEADFKPGQIDVLQPADCLVEELRYGTISAEAGHAAFVAIEKVIELAKSGKIHAAVTGPINKEAINVAGHNFPGHTEIFASYTGTKDYAMLLIYGDLRVIHVTTHVPLEHVSRMVTKQRVLKVIELAHDVCRKLGLKHSRIGVAGLNPHAGDGGLFGRQEQQHITPAIEAAKSTGINAEGPVPADTLFPKAIGGLYDICVAMYHDQGHIPLKLTGFIWDKENKRWHSVNGVNITLGLPIIRTSVDHGTAFDIAGKGIASPDSLINAIEYAVTLANANKKQK